METARGRRAGRYSAWPRQRHPDLLRRNTGVCDLLNSFMWVQLTSMKALDTFPPPPGLADGRLSLSYYFVGSQADNLSTWTLGVLARQSIVTTHEDY
jgi:hypothetical protein